MAINIIYDDNEIQVIHRLGDPGSTLLAFSAILYRPNEPDYWASSPADKYDLNCISFSPKSKNYFPMESISKAKPAIDKCLSGVVVGYGSSMGAYAALKYSSLFKSSITLAFSPQVSVSPSDVPFDEVRHCYYSEIKNGDMLVRGRDLSGAVCVFFDPKHPIDAGHIELLRKNADGHSVTAVPVPYGGHDIINLVADARLFSKLYECCLLNDIGHFKRLMKSATRKSDTYRLNLGRYCIRHGKKKISSEVFQSLDKALVPEFLSASVQSIEYLNSGYPEDARVYAEVFLRNINACYDYGAASTVGWVCSQLGRYYEALLCYRKAIEIEPNVISSHFGYIDTLSAMGLFVEASSAASKALAIFNDAELYGKLGWAALAGGDKNLALDSFKRGLLLNPSIAHLSEGMRASL